MTQIILTIKDDEKGKALMQFLENYMLVIEKIQKGETFVLVQDNRPLAELFPISSTQKKYLAFYRILHSSITRRSYV